MGFRTRDLRTDLPPFNEYAICPECGYDGVMVLFHSIESVSRCSCDVPRRTTKRDGRVLFDSHVCRSCGRCGYEWPQRWDPRASA